VCYWKVALLDPVSSGIIPFIKNQKVRPEVVLFLFPPPANFAAPNWFFLTI
jgi:hypothetical protein